MPGDDILIQDGVQYGVQIAEYDLVIGRQLVNAGKAAVSQIVFEFFFRRLGLIFPKGQILTKSQRINGNFHIPPAEQRGQFRGKEIRIGAGDNDISQAIRQK